MKEDIIEHMDHYLTQTNITDSSANVHNYAILEQKYFKKRK